MRDDGFSVSDAIRLDQAAAELLGLFEASGIQPGDRKHPSFSFYGVLPTGPTEAAMRETWVATTVLRTISETALRDHLSRGDLAVWTADELGERKRDPGVLFGPSQCAWHDTFATGRYIPVQGQPPKPPSYVNARLWLKNDEWAAFRSSLMSRRGPGTADLVAALDEEVRRPEGTGRSAVARGQKLGRPVGTGLDQVDAPLLRQMIDLRRTGKVASLTAAARIFADQASGNATWEAKVRRLQRAAKRMEEKGE